MILSSCVVVLLIVKRKRMFENASSFLLYRENGNFTNHNDDNHENFYINILTIQKKPIAHRN